MINKKIWNINLPVLKGAFVTNISPKQYDTASNLFKISLYKDMEKYDLTGLSVQAVFKKADGTISYLPCTITNAASGELEVDVTSQVLAIAAEVECEIRVTGTDGELLIAPKFYFKVYESLNIDGAVQSQDEFPVLVELLNRVETVESDLQNITPEQIAQVTTNEQTRQNQEAARQAAEAERAGFYAGFNAQLADIANGSAIEPGAIGLEKTDNNLQSLLFETKGTRNVSGKIVRLYDYIPLSVVDYDVSLDTTKVIALGKNLLNQDNITGFNGGVVVTKSTGRIDIVNNNSYVAYGKILLYLKPGAYTISALEHNATQIALYRNGVYAAGLLPGLNKSATFTVPDEAYPYEMQINVPANGGTAFAKELMIEYGTLKTDYMLYKAPVEYTSGLPVTADDTLMADGTDIVVTYRTNKLKFADNPLYGKKAIFNGDSIAAASVGGVVGYPALIAQANGMDMINYGVDGGTIAYYAGKHCISRTVANMAADADYIIFEGGINDYWLNIPLGTISDGYSAALNDTTFCGAFEQMLKNAILKWQGKKIGYVLIHKVYGTTPQAYWDKAREICKKWSIPLLDLYDNSGLVYDLEPIRTAYSNNADGCHPNLGGYQIIYPKIEAWMKTL